MRSLVLLVLRRATLRVVYVKCVLETNTMMGTFVSLAQLVAQIRVPGKMSASIHVMTSPISTT